MGSTKFANVKVVGHQVFALWCNLSTSCNPVIIMIRVRVGGDPQSGLEP